MLEGDFAGSIFKHYFEFLKFLMGHTPLFRGVQSPILQCVVSLQTNLLLNMYKKIVHTQICNVYCLIAKKQGDLNKWAQCVMVSIFL